jgi:glycosyltransferase involved in cell wall biosynthesis
MEAMLRGIPVIASDWGGLKESKEGTGYVVPVAPIERYELTFDERGMPQPVAPPTPIEPWREALSGLLASREEYTRESERSRAAALSFVGGLRAAQLEEYLLGLQPREAAAATPARMESLTPAQRALLLERLRRRKREGA